MYTKTPPIFNPVSFYDTRDNFIISHHNGEQLCGYGTDKIRPNNNALPQIVQTPLGIGSKLSSSGTANLTFKVNPITIGTGDFTLAFYFQNYIDQIQSYMHLFGASGINFAVLLKHNNIAGNLGFYNGSVIDSGLSCAASGVYKIVIRRKNNKLKFFKFYQNETSQRSLDIVDSSSYGAITQLTLNGYVENSPQGVDATVYVTCFSLYAFTDEQIQAFADNPWSIFPYTELQIKVAASTTNINIYGIASAVSDAAGSIKASVAMSGASIAITSTSGVINQSLGLTGSAASISIANGVATLTTSLSGDAFNQAFAGGLFNQFTALSGGVSGQSGATGALDAGDWLEGGATVQSTALGTVNLSITLSGASVANALAQADLDSGLANDLSGSAQAIASGNGQLYSSITVMGVAPVIITGSGATTSHTTLSAAAASVINGNGDLSVDLAGLDGSAIIQALAGGAITTSLSLSASALARAMASAQLTPDEQAMGWLIGDILIRPSLLATVELNRVH